MRCNLDECNECLFNEEYNCPFIPQGKIIKEYSLCEGTHGKKYDLWEYRDFTKEWYIIKSDDNKSKCKA